MNTEIETISPVYVVGHVNPDTDSVASALGYAWLLNERDGRNAIPCRSGHLTVQTTFILQKLGLGSPKLLSDASPRFERISRPLPSILPDHPLGEAWQTASHTGCGAPIVDDDGRPLGMVTSTSIFRFISSQINAMVDLENVSVSRLLSVQCGAAMDTDVIRFPSNMRIRDAYRRVVKEKRDEFIVTNENGTYSGVCRYADILNPPRIQLVLVDHNESSQSIRSIEEADIVEVLDHHRLGAQHTKNPISFTIATVGSTCTLVAEQIADSGLEPPPAIAAVLLAGIITDTLILTSPTTTKRDRVMADVLSVWAAKGNTFQFENFQKFGEEILSSGAGLLASSTDAVIQADLKLYEEHGVSFGIAQIEVGTLIELKDHVEKLTRSLNALREQKGLTFAVLMVTDVVRTTSRIILAGNTFFINNLPYTALPDATFEAPGVVSRKKQLLPVILGLLE